MKKLALTLLILLAFVLAPSISVLAQTTVPGTSVTTTGPVTSATTIQTGTYAGQALMWVATAFSGVVGTALTAWLWKLLNLTGLQVADSLRSKLQEIIVNGLNAGAKAEADNLRGKGQIQIKNDVIAHAVVYAQSHGAETLKALGLDPTSPQAVEAIKARIETAIADPATPTPAVLDPTAAAPALGGQK
jgi:hypothetical protein